MAPVGYEGTSVTASHPMRHGLVVTAGQLAGIAIGLGQIKRFEYSHDLLGMLHAVPSSGLDDTSTPSSLGRAAHLWIPAG